jgi:hypothetical protein
MPCCLGAAVTFTIAARSLWLRQRQQVCYHVNCKMQSTAGTATACPACMILEFFVWTSQIVLGRRFAANSHVLAASTFSHMSIWDS